jgi:MFS family permease
LNYTDRYVLSAVLPKVVKDLSLSSLQAGLLGSSFLLVYGISTLPLGIWADRSVRKNIVTFCVTIWSVATVLAGFARNFLMLFSVRAILGIGEAGYAPASLSLLGDYFPIYQRGRVLSFWSGGQLIGAAIGFTMGGIIAGSVLGWRWAFFIVGIPGLIAAFLAWRMSEPKRGAFDHADHPEMEGVETEAEVASEVAQTHGSLGKDFGKTAGTILKIPTYLILLAALTFSFFTIGATSFWLPQYLVDSFTVSIQVAGILSGIVLVTSGLIGTLLGGYLADRAQRTRPEGRLIVAAIGLLVGAPLTLVALLLHTLIPFMFVVILAVTFLNFCVGPLNAVIQDIILPDYRATALGLSLLCAHLLGDAASPTIVGALADKSSLGFALTVTAPTFLFLAGLACLAGLRTVARDMHSMRSKLK